MTVPKDTENPKKFVNSVGKVTLLQRDQKQ